jgi:hypothetical protein
VDEFISEDDLKSFDGWLRYQAIDATEITPEELETWRRIFEDARQCSAVNPNVELMKLQPVPGEYRYAVVVRDLADLRITLWVKRSRKGEFFIMLPRGERAWDVHTRYHLDGTLHMKTNGSTLFTSDRRQPLTGTFRGSEHLGAYFGYGPKSVGAICDPMAFTGVVEVSSDLWGPMDGWVAVDLVEPGTEPTMKIPNSRILTRKQFTDLPPWVVITVGLLAG